MVMVSDLQSIGRQFNFRRDVTHQPSTSRSHAHGARPGHEAVKFGTGQRAVVLCSLECNPGYRCGVALAVPCVTDLAISSPVT